MANYVIVGSNFIAVTYIVLAVLGVDNINANDININIIFTNTDSSLYVHVVLLSAKDNKKLLNLFSKGFERSVYLKEYKIKSKNNSTTNEYTKEYRYFLKLNFAGANRLFVLVYLTNDSYSKRYKAKKVLFTNRCY